MEQGDENYSEKEKPPSDWGEYWHESISARVDNNEKTVVENRIYLEKIDVKVTWLVRIIAAIITAGAVRYSVIIFSI